MHAETEVADDLDLCRVWRELLDDPDSPDRAELTELGEVVVSPRPTNIHQAVTQAVTRQIEQQLGGAAYQELCLLTKDAGIRCPDAVWLPDNRRGEIRSDPLQAPPPLVVEVLSPGNYKKQVAHKVAAYLDTGIREVITVALDGTVTYHRADGPHPESALGVKLDLPVELFQG